jgi:hypothetical protein
MKLNRRDMIGGAVASLAAAGLRDSRNRSAEVSAMRRGGGEIDDLAQAAVGAYIFAYPLVLMDVTREHLTAVPRPTNRQAPVNQFAHSPGFPDHTFESVVSPNVDALYSTAWLDLSEEPVILSVPDTGDRYYLMQILDGWTNVLASPGTRTTGSGAGAFAITGPGWNGTLPEDVQAFASPTSMAWIIGRTETKGTVDYDAVHALQARYTLTPLNAWGTSYTPPSNVPVDPAADTATAPPDQLAGMSAADFWMRFAAVMIGNPPMADDAPMVALLGQLGIKPGQPLAWEALSPRQLAALETGVAMGLQQIEAVARQPTADLQNGWAIFYRLGTYGTNYMLRAAIAWLGLGANLPEDGLYPTTRVDSDGQPLHGTNQYVLRFAADEIPPVDGFWSLTMYNDRQHFVDNPIRRYAIRDGDPLVFGDDGSLEILVQHDSPGPDLEANWLPAPPDAFNLMLRLYWPRPEVLDGSWVPPAVTRVEQRRQR